MYHISRRVGKTWDSLTQYLRRIEQLAAIRNTRIEAQPQSTAEQLTAIETQATEYTPPEGWQEVPLGEPLKGGDEYHAGLDRYIRPIGPKPQPEPEPQPVQVREGRWKMRGGHHVSVAPIAGDDFASIAYGYTWRGIDRPDLQWNDNGVHLIDSGARSKWDLVTYLGPIEPDKTQELPGYTPPEGWRVLQVGEALREGDVIVHKHDAMYATARAGGWVGANQRYIRRIEPQPEPEPQAAAIEELRSEVSYVQRLLGESRQRVTHLEELVTSLRTINEGQEKAFNAANKANDDLQHRLDVVSKEWADQAATSNGLRAQLDKRDAQIRDLKIELDSLQQVPADSTPMTNNDVISRSDAVDAVVLAAVEHVVAIVARLHNTQVTPELHNTIVQAIGQLTAQSPEQHDEAIPPVVAEHCDAMPALVQSVFYNIPDAG